jgi:hypothetical protein
MKNLIYSTLALLFAASLLSWQWSKNQHPTIDKKEVIECLNMETQHVAFPY